MAAAELVSAPSLSKAETALAWLREQILSGAYGPGHRVVLSTVADELDMSVVPVREAVRRLESEGLVTFERNVGARVAIPDENAYRDAMQALGILEGAATGMAASDLDDDAVAEARAINDRLARTVEGEFDPHEFTRLNHEFHERLFRDCPNQRLVDLVRSEWERLARLRDSTFAFVPERARESVREHERLLDLIASDAQRHEIERAARAHRANTLHSYYWARKGT